MNLIRKITLTLLLLIINNCSSNKFLLNDFENDIISAKQWGSIPAIDSLTKKHKLNHITLHHQGEPFPKGKDPVQYLRNLQKWSREEKHWIDIPYHFVIDLEGKVFEGRNINYAGDTNTEYDPTGHVLIEVVGNFEEVEPNEKQLEAIVKTMAWLSIKYKIPIDSIRGHKDYSNKTVCPGKNLYRYLENGYIKKEVAKLISN